MRTSRLLFGIESLGLLSLCLLLLGLLALGLIPGCGGDESPKDDVAPTVLATVPVDGATDVSPYPIVRVRFSESMDAASIDTLTFHIDGVRTYMIAYDADEHEATLYPKGLVEPGTEYAVHVEEGIADASGNAMEQDSVFHFTTGAIDCEHLGDRFDPNDAIPAATPVETDVRYPGLISCGGDGVDYYRFSLSQAKQVKVSTEVAYVDTERVNWRIDFRREDGLYYVDMGTSAYAVGGSPSLRYNFLPGTYWVDVGKYNTDDHMVLYHLKVETLDPVPDDAYEDNDFPDQATPLESGLHEGLRGTFVDADNYSIHLTAGQTLTVTATEITSTGTSRRLGITNAEGGWHTGHTDQVNPAVETWTATETGTYLIHVRWWADNVIYNLNIEVSG